MWTAIIEKTGGTVLHVYQGAPHPSEEWDAHFPNNLSNPKLVDHVEIPDRPGEDFLLNPRSLKWEIDLDARKERLEAAARATFAKRDFEERFLASPEKAALK